MFATLGLLTGLALGRTPQPMDQLRLYRELRGVNAARVSIWLDRSSPYNRGDRARVYVTADRDAYLTVLRIDTDGRVRVLFPQDPWEDNLVSGGRTFEVEDRDGGRAFRVDDSPGQGYLFAIASDERFDYTPILTQRDQWDYRTIADGQVRGDPYVAVTELAEKIVPTGNYDYDLAQYDVGRNYDYPRFVCYDCHAYAPYNTWNPYARSCVRFRVVIYDDPYYYPYRYYGGRRVVVRPRRPEPRYVFVDNNGGRDYVTRIPTRPRRDEGGGGGTTGGSGEQMRPRRGVDIGGQGTIAVPGGDRRRVIRGQDERPADQGQRQPDQRTPNGQRPERRERPRDEGTTTPGLRPEPRRMEPMKEPPRDNDQRPEQRPEPRRMEPEKQPPGDAEPRREPEQRAEPQRPPEQRPEPRREPERRTEPRRDPPPSSRGGGRSGSPELRRRRG